MPIKSMHNASSLAQGYMQRTRSQRMEWLQSIPFSELPNNDALSYALGIIDSTMGDNAAGDFGEWMNQIQTMREKLPATPPMSHDARAYLISLPMSEPTQQRKFMVIDIETMQVYPLCVAQGVKGGGLRETRSTCDKVASERALKTGHQQYIVEIVATVVRTQEVEIEGFHPND